VAAVRVVSLVPSVTETLAVWGVTPVACTRFCERPDLPHVGGTKDPDLQMIVALAPDLVVMDEEENRRPDHDALVAAGSAVLALAVRSLADVGPALVTLAGRLGVEPPADQDLGGPVLRRAVRAYVPIWRRPWMALGEPTYGSSLLAALGMVNVAAGLGAYPPLGPDEAARLHPDVVVAPDEPYPFGPRHVLELAAAAPVRLVDGKDLFWWGARTPSALARLAARLTEPTGDGGPGDGPAATPSPSSPWNPPIPT